jgi:hypothetical protein
MDELGRWAEDAHEAERKTRNPLEVLEGWMPLRGRWLTYFFIGLGLLPFALIFGSWLGMVLTGGFCK